ncbi:MULTISPECIES: M1 family metallopeptidase [unclassified Paenibacillus]|uniref:M1 family metallopeptidase n=1 Tax=unclassified Paenibacillus TaxID=185978 RepID=UPI001C11DD86|nr:MULTISPECIES: M1 family metallopeptidase [unclassified Paenibacillus]MBU5445260.1 M1 family metallopeptidase [Paenibacillus sp. MSJ-34]CAH0121777.1 hypothetical protein PAE9249_04311 [Paenibacillus sp. CECT 9249]
MTSRHTKRIVLISLSITIAAVFVLWMIYSKSDPSITSFGPEGRQNHGYVEPQTIQSPKSEVLSDRLVEYHINVRLDDSGPTKSLFGEQTVSWTNPGKNEVEELYFHLYPNAFESMNTTFMRESGGRLRNDTMKEGGYGSMEVTDVLTTEGASLMQRASFVQPDDNNAHDRTLMKIRLPQPIKPDETVTLKMKFTVKLPQVFARMGAAGDFVMAGQWFPKLSAYETAGMRGRTAEGWNLHQYHGNSEFYSNFGIYSVNIQVPSSYIVAATGFPTGEAVVRNGTKTYQYYADDVHDFAWAASPDFIYAEEPFSAPNVPGVRIKLYLDPLHKDLKERYFHAAKASLTRYSEWFGQYPYSTLSIVVPPKDGNGAGGMEYPTLVTAFGAESGNPGYDLLERTVVHEIGHQYFYGMIASNEFEEAWLDEGFTSYAEDRVMEAEYGIVPNLPIQASYMTDPAPLPQLAWQFNNHSHYAENVYTRAKLVLIGIERQVGTKTMNKIMRTYFNKWRFKHPTTADFQRVVEQVTKKKWTDYFNQYVYGGLMADFAVERIDSRTIEVDGVRQSESFVVIRKRGGDYHPVPIVFQFQDGKTVRKNWDGQTTTVQYKLTHTSPLEWVMIDPQHTIVLENKHINNYMKAHVEEPVRTRWNLSVVKIIESLLNALAW